MTSRHFRIVREGNLNFGNRVYAVYSHPQNNGSTDEMGPRLEAIATVITIGAHHVVSLGTNPREFEPTGDISIACRTAYGATVTAARRAMYTGDTIEDTVNEFEQKELFS